MKLIVQAPGDGVGSDANKTLSRPAAADPLHFFQKDGEQLARSMRVRFDWEGSEKR